MQPGGSNPSGNIPQAFLTVIFFDERFNFIEAADGGVAQQQVAASVGSNGSSLTLANIKAPKNGYAYIYISNQSNNDVYFDDLQVGLTTGNIIEENHYYAYGLKIAGISSKKLGDSYEGQLKNNYLYQGAYSELDDDIGWHDFMLRNYDAQIGRWVQQDPYHQFASPYSAMGLNPITNTDPTGGIVPIGGMSQTAATAITLGEVVIRSVSTTAKTVSSLGNILLKGLNITTKVFQVANVLNSSNNTIQVGQQCPDCPTGRMAEEKGLEGVTVVSHQRKVGSLKDLLKESLVNHTKHVWLGEKMINKIKKDDDYKSKVEAMKDFITQDLRYGQEDFDVDLSIKKEFQGLELGGKRHSDPMWKQALWQVVPIYGPWRYRKTWKVALNELTWALRHVTIKPTAHVSADGGIMLSFRMSDIFNLNPSPGREPEYNKISEVLGFFYHDLGGGTPTKISGSWTEYIAPGKKGF